MALRLDLPAVGQDLLQHLQLQAPVPALLAGDPHILYKMPQIEGGGKVPVEHLGGNDVQLAAPGRSGTDGLIDPRRVQACPLGVGQRLAHPCQRPGDGDLVGHLGVLARARASLQHDVLPHGLQHGQHLLEHGLIAAGHDGQRPVGRAGISPGHRGVQGVQPPLPGLVIDALGQLGAGGGHVDEHRPGLCGLQQSPGAKIDLLHVLGIAHDGDDYPTAGGALGGAVLPDRSLPLQCLCLAPGAVVDLDRVARLHQIADHPLSHDAGADKSNGLHVCTPLFCLRCIQHITLFPPRQGGGPILPGRLERGSEDFRPLRGGGFPAIIQISYGYGRFQIFLFRMQ